MKKGRKLLTWLAVVIVIILVLAIPVNLFKSRFLKPKLEEGLTDVFNQPVKIQNLGVDFIFSRATIRDVEIKNPPGFPSPYLLKADKIIIEGNFLFQKKIIVLKQLVMFNPEINIDYMGEGNSNLSFLYSKEGLTAGALGISGKDKTPLAINKGLFIKKVLIKNAKINIFDYEKGKPYSTVAEGVDIGITNFIHWLRDKELETFFIIRGGVKSEPPMNFDIQGKLAYPEKKIISGSVELVVRNIPLVHFSPYYASALSFLEVENGRADIYSRIKCERNNLIGISKLVINDYTLKAKDEDGASIIRIGEFLEGGSGKIELMVRLGGTIYQPTYTLSTDISEAKTREFFNRLPGLNLSSTLLDSTRKASGGVSKHLGDIFGRLFLRKK